MMPLFRRKPRIPKAKKPKRHVRRFLLSLLLMAIVIGTGLYLNSDRFAEHVRQRVVATVEDVTGGRVELRSFRWNLSRLEFDARDLTIHGLEPEGQIPYAHVDRLLVRLKILSFFSADIGLRYLKVEHPVIHLMVFHDGTTNQPVPRIRREQ